MLTGLLGVMMYHVCPLNKLTYTSRYLLLDSHRVLKTWGSG